MARQTSPLNPAEIEEMEDTLVPDAFPVETKERQPEQRVSTHFEDEHQETSMLHAPPRLAPLTKRAAAAQEPPPEGHDLLLAQAGAWHIGLLADEVESVNSWRSPVPLPHAPPAVLGVVSVRGRMLTVIDPAILLGEGSTERPDAVPAFIIVLRGDEQLALAVNRVGGNIGIYLSEIDDSGGGLNSNIMRGTIPGAHGRTIVLDAREIFAAAMHGAERRRQRF